MNASTGIGIMSGTSLDGTDIALCRFDPHNPASFEILKALTVPYPQTLYERLSTCMHFSGLELARLHTELGRYYGQLVNEFLRENEASAAFIASHGHTVFHRPDEGLTLQIGSGAEIAAQTGLPVICDFRTTDVALGGQGAPLVPIGDEWLFPQYDFCLNLGGFSNISFRKNGSRVASDCGVANMALNYLARQANLEYDPEGTMAAAGSCDESLLESLDRLPFYTRPFPKSLGKEWFEQEFRPLLDASSAPLNNKLHTVCVHSARQIAALTRSISGSTMLVTGGGAFNRFLLTQLEQATQLTLVIPDKQLIAFKEALVFAFLGYLRLSGRINTLHSVTGARFSSTGGAVYAGIPATF